MIPTIVTGASCGVYIWGSRAIQNPIFQHAQTLPAYMVHEEKPSKHPREVPVNCSWNTGPAPHSLYRANTGKSDA